MGVEQASTSTIILLTWGEEGYIWLGPRSGDNYWFSKLRRSDIYSSLNRDCSFRVHCLKTSSTSKFRVYWKPSALMLALNWSSNWTYLLSYFFFYTVNKGRDLIHQTHVNKQKSRYEIILDGLLSGRSVQLDMMFFNQTEEVMAEWLIDVELIKGKRSHGRQYFDTFVNSSVNRCLWHYTIDRLEKRGVEKRKRLTIFLERTRKGHRQSDQHWNCLKGNTENFWETGQSAFGLFRASGYHLELN